MAESLDESTTVEREIYARLCRERPDLDSEFAAELVSVSFMTTDGSMKEMWERIQLITPPKKDE